MKVVFFGTPEFAATFLQPLIDAPDISVSAVVCQPDKPVGRKQVMTAPATKLLAEQHNIPVFQPASLKRDPKIAIQLAEMKPDAFIVVAYGKIIPQSILDIPHLGSINVHPSKLPQYRGPSPIQAAIANQDAETAITIMLIDAEMDHGPILAQQRIELHGTETPETLRATVSELGGPLLVETTLAYAARDIEPQEQDHESATFCKLLKREDGHIDWSQPAEVIEAQIRAYTPWPGTYALWDDQPFKIHQARIDIDIAKDLPAGTAFIESKRLFIATGTQPLELITVQPPGKAKMDAKAFLNGNPEIHHILLS